MYVFAINGVLLDTGSLCVLGYYRDVPAVKMWNGPLPD
jgi:hypothetical protein